LSGDDDCFRPCDNELLKSGDGKILTGRDRVPVKVDVKKVLDRRLFGSSPV